MNEKPEKLKKKINILFGLNALVNRKPVEDMSFLERRELPIPYKYRSLYFGGKA